MYEFENKLITDLEELGVDVRRISACAKRIREYADDPEAISTAAEIKAQKLFDFAGDLEVVVSDLKQAWLLLTKKKTTGI